MPWNFHEPTRGAYRFDGARDVEHFVQLAADEGLFVVLRPGPYICAEWHGGGLPFWLLNNEPHMHVRTRSAPFLHAVAAWFDVLMPRIRSLLFHNGGPVVLVQVSKPTSIDDTSYLFALNSYIYRCVCMCAKIENEYGNFGFDVEYMRAIRQLFVERNIDCLLITADGAHGLFVS